MDSFIYKTEELDLVVSKALSSSKIFMEHFFPSAVLSC